MAGTYAVGSITILDFEKDDSTTGVYPKQLGLTGVFDYGEATQNLDEFKDAVQSISLGKVVKSSISITFLEDDQDAPTNPEANNASKWSISYYDTQAYLDDLQAVPNPGFRRGLYMTIACADGSLLHPGEKKLRLDEAGVIADFVDAFELNVRTLYNKGTVLGTRGVKITDIERVGANV